MLCPCVRGYYKASGCTILVAQVDWCDPGLSCLIWKPRLIAATFCMVVPNQQSQVVNKPRIYNISL